MFRYAAAVPDWDAAWKQPSQGQAYSAAVTKTVSDEDIQRNYSMLQFYSDAVIRDATAISSEDKEMSQVWQEGAGVVYFLF